MRWIFPAAFSAWQPMEHSEFWWWKDFFYLSQAHYRFNSSLKNIQSVFYLQISAIWWFGYWKGWKKLFPIFTGDFPTFQRWNGLLIEGFPEQHEDLGSEGTASRMHKASKWSFWRHLKESMKGRGIVISLGENGVGDVKRLLKVLRAIGNKLPIQLVHKGDVPKAAMQDIIKVGRGDFNLEIEISFTALVTLKISGLLTLKKHWTAPRHTCFKDSQTSG